MPTNKNGTTKTVKSKFNLWMSTGLVIMMAAAPIAYAGSGHGQCNFGSSRGGWKAGGDLAGKFFWKAHSALQNADAVGLSDKQQEDIRALMMDVKRNLIKQEAEIKIVSLDVKEQMQAASLDTDAINKLIDQKYELKKAKAKFLVQSIAQLKKSLNEEQHAKLKDLFQKKAGFQKRG